MLTVKKLKKLFIVVIAVAIGCFAMSFILYLATTKSPTACIEYCVENSSRGATEFVRFADGRYVQDYTYWIASNGDSSKTQEIFIFKRKFIGPFKLDRYVFVISSNLPSALYEKTEAGSIRFFTENDDGEKDIESTLLFYGATADSNIKRFEYTLTNRHGSNIYSEDLKDYDGVWFVQICGINDIDEKYKYIISNVNFYDENNNVVCSFLKEIV